jgi:hypothetical protein
MTVVIGCPKGYQDAIRNWTLQANRNRYRGKIPATRAKSLWEYVTGTVANYDGDGFILRSVTDVRLGPAFIGQEFQYYVSPTPAPAPPIIGIDLTGIPDAAGIGAATAAAIQNADIGFSVSFPPPLNTAIFWVYQNLPGVEGNTEIVPTGSASWNINGFDVFSNTPLFYGGQSLDIPLLWGPQRAMGPSTANTPRVVPGEE